MGAGNIQPPILTSLIGAKHQFTSFREQGFLLKLGTPNNGKPLSVSII